MFFHPDERVILSIDGANLYATGKALGVEIDFRLLLEEFRSKCRLLRAFYYTAILEDQDTLRPLVDWLDYNGFSVVTKYAKEFVDSEGRRKVKGNMDMDLAVDAMELAPHYDHLVLFSGDGDFTKLVVALQRAGKRVTVASSMMTPKPLLADDLRRQADHFLEVADFATRASSTQASGTQPVRSAKVAT